MDSLNVKNENFLHENNVILPCVSPSSKGTAAVAFNVKLERAGLLMLPILLQLLEFHQVARLGELNKAIYNELRDNPQQCGYWNAMCISLCNLRGLYSPFIYELSYSRKKISLKSDQVKKHFWSDLWPARNKWKVEAMEDLNSRKDEEGEFKICVACRFRPGVRGKQDMNLPLHQFLKLRRKEVQSQIIDDQSDPQDKSILVGMQDPPEFLDPFLNCLMRQPVLLTTSNRILEHAIAVQCLLRNGRDPFNSRKLSRKDIVPQPELQARIKQWKEEKEHKTQESLAVGLDKVKTQLIDASAVDPALLEILQDAEKLSALADKTERLARRRKQFGTKAENEQSAISGSAEPEEEDLRTAIPLVSDADELANHGELREEGPVSVVNAVHSDEKTGWRKTQEAPRVVDVNEQSAQVNMHVHGVGVRNFQFSHVFDAQSTQVNVFNSAISPTIGHIMNGYNASILCYGQTGGGKTHTFFGPTSKLEFDAHDVHEYISMSQSVGGLLGTVSHSNLPDTVGLSVRACIELLIAKKHCEHRGINVNINLQYIEVHENTVTDLLTGEPVDIRRETGELVNAAEVPLEDVPSLLNILSLGQERKRFAATAMNERSSRSHTAMIIQVLQLESQKQIHASEEPQTIDLMVEEGRMVRSVLHLIDLAGSERVKKSKVQGTHFDETVGINSSLLVLGKCIAALVESKSHVPYLESKLTTMLRAAFGGNSRTTAIICTRSDDEHGEETLQSLRFGERCSMISNKTKSAAQSVESTLAALNASVIKVHEQLVSLERRGKHHLPSFAKLQASFLQIQKKRDELAKIVQKKQNPANSRLPLAVL